MTEEAVRLADWAQGVPQSTIQQLLAVATRADILSLALGLPAAELFPISRYAQATQRVLSSDPHSLQYGPPWQHLKRHVVELMALRGVICTEEQVFLTSGAQQAMSLLSRLLLNQGGAIILEETIYSGILQAAEPLQPELLFVPTYPGTGIDIDAVEALLCSNRRPAFIYAISDGHNPLGVSLTLEKRQRLVDLSRHYQVPILEDDAYGFLSYEQETLPPMKALDAQWVLYLGSFSKILAPALRTGWIVVPEELMPGLAALKEGSDINTATLAQRTIAAYLDTDHLVAEHLTYLRQSYKGRRDAMIHALQTYFPPDASYSIPTSGMFIWVTLSDEIDTEQVLKRAIEQQHVAFVPGLAFSPYGSPYARHSMRLNFSRCDCENIERAVALLAQVLVP